MEDSMYNIIVDGQAVQINSSKLTYETAVSLAGYSADRVLSVTVKCRGVDGKILSPGRTVDISEGAVINVADTSGA